MLRKYVQSSSRAIPDEELRIKTPAVFSHQPQPGVSERYGFVPTIDVVNGLRKEGWFPVTANQTRVRDTSEALFARHMLRFRRLDDPIHVGDSLAELVLTNSHDRSTCYSLDIGLFRCLCENGLIVSTNDFGSLKVRHGRNIVGEVIDASYEVIDNIPRLTQRVDTFTEVALEDQEQRAFAEAAMMTRWGDAWQVKCSVTVDALLEPRRFGDANPNLWSTYNRVQENLLRGGLHGRSKSGKLVSTRAIKGVTENMRLNKALWALTERMAELKAA